MVQKKKIVENEITILTKSKSVFENEITERIEIGQKILNEKIEDNITFSNVKQKFSEWSDYNLELLKQSFNLPNNEYWRSYNNAGNYIGIMTINLDSRPNPAKDLQDFKIKFDTKIDNLTKLKNKIQLLKSYIEEDKIEPKSKKDLNMSQVFIVHGHDELVKIEVARFIEKLGFEPIILHEQASSGKTVIEKIESYSNVGFGIVLYTPCDLGSKKGEEANLNPRARQNVIFEHGYLIGKIGRENVCALVKQNIEIPNDISGVVYISLGESWKIDVAKELRNSGYSVDMNMVI